MKVILRKDLDNLGTVGSVVDVKDGYARNYLIPRDLVFPASKGNMRALEEEQKQASKRSNKEKKSSEHMAQELEKVSITLQMKVGEDEKLFGAVTSQMISDALAEKKITLDKRSIELEEPIKSLGIYDVPVKLPQGVAGNIKVWVVRE
ncbi:MAG: 50S ribosomal protein L9 [Ignavibacteria bacterium]|nr:50S ribosomal protein L9 [Ignavibacteria bacterium]